MSTVEERTKEELRAQIEELAQHYLDMSADEFLKCDCHDVPDTPATRYMLVLSGCLRGETT